MGKKDKKDPAKKQAKLEKQAKKLAKGSKKDVKDSALIDIDSLLADFAKKESKKQAVSIEISSQPSPRFNFSMTALPNGDMLMFGGEHYDGDVTTIYNDLYRWSVDKNEWKKIESLNTPPPRCSHQAVYYMNRLYLFGGEYSTLDQFHHYRDFWSLDLTSNVWTELTTTGEGPSARSGHRMQIWRNFLVVFGGFYEALKEMRWFNDLYIFSFQEMRWSLLSTKSGYSVPKPRSGCQLAIHANEDVLYLYGGYSKERNPTQKNEGIIHDDMWFINLKSLAGQSVSKGLDMSHLQWSRINKKGQAPSRRCGASMITYKNKALIFGGVLDEEGKNHSITSTFYNDIFAFDMDRKRWFQLGLKQKKSGEKTRRRARKSDKVDVNVEKSTNSGDFIKNDDDDDNNDDDDGDDDDDDCDGDDAEQFVFLDDNGDAVYIPYDKSQDDELTLETINAATVIEQTTIFKAEINNSDINICKLSLNTNQKMGSSPLISTRETEGQVDTTLHRHFAHSSKPCPRINACIMIRGSTLYVYGGVTELGDIEITCDDCWSLNLGKLDNWTKILPGTMHLLTWKGEDLDGTEGTRSDDEDDDDHDNEDESDDDSDGSDVDVKETSNSNINLSLSDANRIPLPGESLKDFYSRTSEFWCEEILKEGSSLNEKQVKNESFKLAKQIYEEINVSSPVIDDDNITTTKKDKDNKNRMKRRGV